MDTGVGFFHGAADPFPAAMPGNTATGFAEGSAETGFGNVFGVGLAVACVNAGGEFALGGGGGGGGGGGATAARLGFGGTNSR